jgi:hypothetical protein
MAVRAKVGHPHNINIEGQLIASKEKEEMSWGSWARFLPENCNRNMDHIWKYGGPQSHTTNSSLRRISTTLHFTQRCIHLLKPLSGICLELLLQRILVVLQELHYNVITLKRMTTKRHALEWGATHTSLPLILVTLHTSTNITYCYGRKYNSMRSAPCSLTALDNVKLARIMYCNCRKNLWLRTMKYIWSYYTFNSAVVWDIADLCLKKMNI